MDSSKTEPATGVRDDFRNWLAWASGPRNAMKIGVRDNGGGGSGEIDEPVEPSRPSNWLIRSVRD